MRKPLTGLLIGLIFIGTSCITPVYERAKIEKGFHWAAGVGYSKGSGPFGSTSGSCALAVSQLDYDLMRIQLLGYYGFSRHLSFFLQVGGSYGIGYDYGLGHTRNYGDIDLGLGIKVSPTDRVAVKLNTGFPSLLDVSLLWDIDKYSTLTLIGRAPYPPLPYLFVAGIGVTFHIPLLGDRTDAHIFLGGGGYPLSGDIYNLQLGLGVGN